MVEGFVGPSLPFSASKLGEGTGRCNSQYRCHFDKSVEFVANHPALVCAWNEAIRCLF